eukprot:scaffold248422_cov56-Cyclotella_meneghiniana.AAC.1
MTLRGCSVVAIDGCCPVRLSMGGAVWVAAGGSPSPGNAWEKSRLRVEVEEQEGWNQPDSEPSGQNVKFGRGEVSGRVVNNTVSDKNRDCYPIKRAGVKRSG